MKGVERNADRQDDVERGRAVGNSQPLEQQDEVLQREVAVLEEPQQPEVHPETEEQKSPTRGSVLGPGHPFWTSPSL